MIKAWQFGNVKYQVEPEKKNCQYCMRGFKTCVFWPKRRTVNVCFHVNHHIPTDCEGSCGEIYCNLASAVRCERKKKTIIVSFTSL